MPPRYREWISHVFDHQDPEWYWSPEPPDFDAPNGELVELIIHTCLNCGRDLAQFTDPQVSAGLNYIFHNGCSDVVFSIMDNDVPLDSRRAAIRSIKQLYANCFEERCAPVLSHLDEPGSNAVNQVCYMLWDVTPLAYWEGNKAKQAFYDEVLSVLRVGLSSPNVACVESALHGLGHIQPYHEAQVTATVRQFIRQNPTLRRELKQYAENAAVGCVQ